MLVIETAFSRREKQLAVLSKHLSPDVLMSELQYLSSDKNIPIYITHTKPAETDLIMSEVQAGIPKRASDQGVIRDIRWLKAGQTFEL